MTTTTTTHSPVISASTVSGYKVCNPAGEDLGKIEEIMLDADANRIAYAVLSFGGFLGLGDKLFAIPWGALRVKEDCCELDVPKERLEQESGFDKDNWPVFADRRWGSALYSHYGVKPYWD